MSLLGTLFCRGGSTNDEKQSSSPTSNGIKNSKMNQFISIKFLYKNPIGRQLTVERFHRSEQSEICRAKDDPSLNNDPQLYEYINSIPNAIRWRGLLLQGYLVYGKVLKQIEQFEIRSDDIWLITYPKSGTTWMEEILSLIQSDCNIDTSKNTLIHERVPHLEVGKPLGHIKWLRGIGSPRLLATHLPIEHIPAQLRANKAKIIYVVRNPKDNAVSYYHHHRMSTFLGNYSGSWSNFAQLFIKGHLVYGDWFDHVAGYWQMARNNSDRVLFISYEELKINLPAMIEVICNFIGHRLTPEQINLIARQCSFDKMKTNKMVNREVLPVKDLFDMTQSKFMRKGIIGDWRNHFSPEENDQFDRHYGDRIRSIGLEMAYDHEEAEEMIKHDGRIIHINKSLE
ncbi:hypothetical protein RDWZM_009256 [Blomia tropicalis]|uniref:Sulfotransferase domain-containing protein n=1 Tax=Blomia tropicalis TaxID=40697 RepID=A0A9Q0M312_BLOTA|nr:hypothetical protein RDWZM_009256 [Blomia tropicalis]